MSEPRGTRETTHISSLTMRLVDRTHVLQAQGVLMERQGYTARAALAQPACTSVRTSWVSTSRRSHRP